jgi:plasmid stabilization system protein ParE
LEVIVTGKAAHDLDEWLSRIEADNPAAAEAFQARIRHWIEVIRQHPQAGHRHAKRREIRTVVESPIIIYYTVSASQIEIPSILAFSQKSKINSLSLAVAEYLEDSAFLDCRSQKARDITAKLRSTRTASSISSSPRTLWTEQEIRLQQALARLRRFDGRGAFRQLHSLMT